MGRCSQKQEAEEMMSGEDEASSGKEHLGKGTFEEGKAKEARKT